MVELKEKPFKFYLKGFSFQICYGCGREGIQTPSLLIRSQTLYSVELRNHFAF